MRTLHFDCFAGISGDMTLGALIDLGVDPAALCTELGKLGLGGWRLVTRREARCGITGTRVLVTAEDGRSLDGHECHEPHAPHEHEHGAHAHEHGEHAHEHGAHAHEHGAHAHEHGEHAHEHRKWRDIRALIEGAALTEGAKRRSLAIFERIARAEAAVHGTALEEVAFHEVGALDSIVDIVGAAVCLDLLAPERITCGAVELGGGTVRCAHGLLPVPAPATAILCEGFPVSTGGFDREMTTPTGAAILAASVDAFVTAGRFRHLSCGTGVGGRTFADKPNVLRVFWREEEAAAAETSPEGGAYWNAESLTLLETNIDDMTGEALGFLMERLFEEGALDVTLSPCVMKKSRPGTVVSCLCGEVRLDALRRTLFAESSAIGFREIPVRRLSLSRRQESVESAWGSLGRKTVFYGEGKTRAKYEAESRAKIARQMRVSLDEAARAAE